MNHSMLQSVWDSWVFVCEHARHGNSIPIVRLRPPNWIESRLEVLWSEGVLCGQETKLKSSRGSTLESMAPSQVRTLISITSAYLVPGNRSR